MSLKTISQKNFTQEMYEEVQRVLGPNQPRSWMSFLMKCDVSLQALDVFLDNIDSPYTDGGFEVDKFYSYYSFPRFVLTYNGEQHEEHTRVLSKYFDRWGNINEQHFHSWRTPLSDYVSSHQYHMRLVKFLLEKGADPLLADKDGLTAVDLACSDEVREELNKWL